MLDEVRGDDRVLDMGTGSGVNAILAASRAREVLRVDINPHAVCGCKRKHRTQRCELPNEPFVVSDLLDAVDGRFDLVSTTRPSVGSDRGICSTTTAIQPLRHASTPTTGTSEPGEQLAEAPDGVRRPPAPRLVGTGPPPGVVIEQSSSGRVVPRQDRSSQQRLSGAHRLAGSTALVRLDGSSTVGVSLTVNDEFALASSSQEGDHRRVAAHGRP